ncbi:MAG: DUF4190 domain-containing protein [Bacteroidales bacterium]|nr:DUF4190 domain-containing protein [Bacteroidales bacterium]
MTDQITKTTAPNAVASLVLGISSLVFSCFLVGLVLGIIGLILGNKALSTYNANPDLYTGDGMIKAGRITSIIGIVSGGIFVLWGLVALVIGGTSAFAIFELLNLDL